MRHLFSTTKMVKDLFSDRLLHRNKSYVHSVFKLNYKEVVKTLNSLQTNAALLQEYKKRGRPNHSVQVQNLEQTIKYLTRSGLTLEQLDGLSVIHVAGTKGKGSTCAFCESILRQHGFRTGFYSSPHLVAARERIRINGQSLGEDEFSKYFWAVYNALFTKKENEGDMPPYFKFLTVMAYNVFLAEKVDVAIVEVGIGGEYDCTNILRKVEAVGITSLGLDHTSLLGDSLEAIAWQKAGIMKPGAVAFTVQQPKEALSVLQTRASERQFTVLALHPLRRFQCPLLVAPPLESYNWGCNFTELRLSASVQALNASLAMQLARAWMLRQSGNYSLAALDTLPSSSQVINGCTTPSNSTILPSAPAFAVPASTLLGLKLCSWPGRTQVICREAADYFLDGAHTVESIEMCVTWFQRASTEMAKGQPVRRVLLFNATGNRDATQLLSLLFNCHFDLAIFCPNIVTMTLDSSSDQANFMVSMKQQQIRCENNEEAWLSLHEKAANHVLPMHDAQTKRFSCVSEAVAYLENDLLQRVHVLVSGSLHLVGSVLSILDPNLTLPTHQLSADVKVEKSLSNGAIGIS